MVTAECDFCREFSGRPGNDFHRIYGGDPESRILFQSKEFVIVPSLGQIVGGYLLVLPRGHLRALGDLPVASLDELYSILQRVGKSLSKEYGPHVLFEHGTRTVGVGGCGIYHAHLHATPLGMISDPVSALKARFPYEQVAELGEITDRTAGMSSYLFYRDSEGGLYVFNTGPLPSQYMRKLLADAMGEQAWDWRAAGREERLLATMQRLSSCLANAS